MQRLFREFAALAAAFFAACAILIPAANYIQWSNRIGLAFIVVLLYGFIRELMPQLETIFRSRNMLLIAAGALLVAGCVFFGVRRPHRLTGETNLITIEPGEFTVIGLARNNDFNKRFPCIGYVSGSRANWKVHQHQALFPRAGAMPLTLELGSHFLRKNKISLWIKFYRPGVLRYSFNGEQQEFVTEQAGNRSIPLNRPDLLRPTAKHRFSAERIVLFTGIAVCFLLGAAFVLKIGEKIARREAVSWELMLALCLIFLIYIAPFLLYGGNCSDLQHHEPNMPLPCGYKHPPLIALWWRLGHLLIPARSVFVSFAFSSLLLYLGGLLMTERFLCKLPEKWPAWSICLFALNAPRFYQNRVIVDEFLVAAAFFSLGLLAVIPVQKCKAVRFCCAVLLLPFIGIVAGLRHEAAGITLAFCIGLAGLLVPGPSRLKFRKIALSVLGGMLLFAALFGIHQLLQKRLIPGKEKSVSEAVTMEIRRYQLKEILKICYYGKHYDWLPADFNAYLPPDFSTKDAPLRVSNAMLVGFDPLPSERIAETWKTLIRQHPFLYLESKFEGFRAVCKRLDSCQASWPEPGFTFGVFTPHLPSAVCCVSLLLTLLVSGVLLLCRPVFRGVLYFAAVTAAAGTAHMAALFVVPVSPQARYLYWVYLTGGISFVLLLYIVWLLIRSRLGRASIRRLYVNR